MTHQVPTLTFPQACERLQTFLVRSARTILGIVGPPGSGKSTLSTRLQALHPRQSQIMPMDGYRLANIELARLGRAGRKGAPDTFDAHGFRSLLQRLRQQGDDEIIYAPEFRRAIEEPVAGAIPIFPQTRLIIAEGNYLALGQGEWSHVAPLLDELWYVQVDPVVRWQRLLARHMQFGRSLQAAEDWMKNTDEPNARLIESTLPRVHFKVDQE